MLDELHEHSQQFSRDRQFSSVVTNLDVASKLAADVLHDREGAHNYSQQALQYRSDIDHWWALQEHLWREAEHYKATGDKERTFETVVDALKIYERSPVVLEPVPGDKGIGRGDLGVMVKQLGIDRLALAEVGINLKPLTLTPLGLSDAMIDRVVSAVM